MATSDDAPDAFELAAVALPLCRAVEEFEQVLEVVEDVVEMAACRFAPQLEGKLVELALELLAQTMLLEQMLRSTRQEYLTIVSVSCLADSVQY